MSTKPFAELTTDEATATVKDIARTSTSADEIERRLKEAGFGDIDFTCYEYPRFFVAEVTVRGSDGKNIRVVQTNVH